MKAHIHMFEYDGKICIRIGPYADTDEDSFVMCDFVGEMSGVKMDDAVKVARVLAGVCEKIDNKTESRIILPNRGIIAPANRKQRRNGQKYRIIKPQAESHNGEEG